MIERQQPRKSLRQIIVAIGAMSLFSSLNARAQGEGSVGSIRGVVFDRDFELPLGGVTVEVLELERRVESAGQGNYVVPDVPPGTYTVIFSKPGYVRRIEGDVLVTAGRLTEVDVELASDFIEMDEFIVQDLGIGAGGELELLQLRLESPSLVDSVSSDLMSRAGASDAASALTLVSGTTVSDGKFAVIRGLPDRYVNSQLNGVRLPSADADTRAVELDQFPATVIDNLQVTKTFTPDQQGDASGGAVNVLLKGIPEELVMQFRGQVSYNTNVAGRSDFLTYQGGGLEFWGIDDGRRDQQLDNIGSSWDGAIGVSTDEAPIDHKWSAAIGGSREIADDVRVGGFASVFYERDSSYFNDGINDSYWQRGDNADLALTPQESQGAADSLDAITSLFDVTRASQSVQWGGLASLGIETDNHQLGLTGLHTRTAEDTATLAEDTRGKDYFVDQIYGVDYDPNDPKNPGNIPGQGLDLAPYLRTESLRYVERTITSLQLYGNHALPFEGFALGRALTFRRPEISWTVSDNAADFYQPDERQFGAQWQPRNILDQAGFIIDTPANWKPFKPAANFNLGNLQRIWEEIEEESNQYTVNVKLPFEQWQGNEGYFKFGAFDDRVTRTFDQDTYSNFGDSSSFFLGDFDDFWSNSFPDEDHAIVDALTDVDYSGKYDIDALYGMLDLPLTDKISLIGGARFETTAVSVRNFPEADAVWFPNGALGPNDLDVEPDGTTAADVSIDQDDVLPSLGLVYEVSDKWTVRASYSQTIARQTFKELTPVIQQEFLGGPIFIGNPELQISSVENLDLRIDYAPYAGGLVSLSLFQKNIDDPIEYVQRLNTFDFTFPVNYPDGRLRGIEAEVRQDMGRFWDVAEGLSLGANATFLDSRVAFPDEDVAAFESFFPDDVDVPRERDLVNTPDYLYNLYATYDWAKTGTQFSIFYTVKGPTLVAGATVVDNFTPSIYAEEFGTLNLSISQPIGRAGRLQLQARNLTNPEIEQFYEHDITGETAPRSSFTQGREFSISLGVSF